MGVVVIAMLKRIYQYTRELRYFLLRDERHAKFPMPWTVRLRMLPRGFLSQAYVLYQLDKNDHRDYLSDLGRIRMGRILMAKNPRAGYRAALDNKLLSIALVRDMLRTPEAYAFIEYGRVLPLAAGRDL